MQNYSKVYDTFSQAERAVLDLQDAGVPSSEISLVARGSGRAENDDPENQSSVAAGAGLGSFGGGGVGLLNGLGVMAIPGVGRVVAAGWLASTAAVAFAGSATGGLIGALVGSGLHRDDALRFTEAVERGGTLVTVKTSLAPGRIETILNRHWPIYLTDRGPQNKDMTSDTRNPVKPGYWPKSSTA